MVAAGFSSNRERADELRQAVEADGGTLSLHQGNIGDADDCERVVNEVIEQHGRLDILVNNAGITVDKPVWKMSADDWDKVLQVDLSGAFYMSKPAIAAHDRARLGADHQHLVGDRRDRQHRPGELRGLEVGRCSGSRRRSPARRRSRSALAGKLENGIGVTVNCITPGLIETDMVATIPPFMVAEFLEKIPMHRMGQPEEIARVVCFLAQDASGYITGQIWDVNGGIDM